MSEPNPVSGAEGDKEKAVVCLDAASIRPAPHVVLRLDESGRLLDIENAFAGSSFADARLLPGLSVHEALHPTCEEPDCNMRLCLQAAIGRIESAGLVEWEHSEEEGERTLRWHLRRVPGAARTYSTLAITDISEGRRAASALREVNRVLTALTRRHESGQVSEVGRLDRKLRTLSAELIVAQEKERTRIASELHDSLGQWLAMTKLSLESALHRFGSDIALADCQRALANVVACIKEVRAIVRHLRPSMLEEFGLVPTIELICHELQVSYPDLAVNCLVTGRQGVVSSPLQIAIVRIAQEATNNVVKHAEARHLEVSVAFSESDIVLRVRDDGRGFPSQVQEPGSLRGLGITSMRERVVQTGGRMRLLSKPRMGTTLSVSWDRHAADVSASGTYKTIDDRVGRNGGSTLEI